MKVPFASFCRNPGCSCCCCCLPRYCCTLSLSLPRGWSAIKPFPPFLSLSRRRAVPYPAWSSAAQQVPAQLTCLVPGQHTGGCNQHRFRSLSRRGAIIPGTGPPFSRSQITTLTAHPATHRGCSKACKSQSSREVCVGLRRNRFQTRADYSGTLHRPQMLYVACSNITTCSVH